MWGTFRELRRAVATCAGGARCDTTVALLVARGGGVSMLEQWQCSQHRMRTVRRRIYAAHLTVCRGIIEQLEQVEIDAFPTAFSNRLTVGLPTAALARQLGLSDTHPAHLATLCLLHHRPSLSPCRTLPSPPPISPSSHMILRPMRVGGRRSR